MDSGENAHVRQSRGAKAGSLILLAAIVTCIFADNGLLAESREPAVTASPWSIRVRQTEDGLPSNQVTGVVQAPDGYLWVATRGGLARFNGSRFEPFSIDPQPGIFGNAVREMFVDAKGNLWLGANRSVVLRVGADSVEVFPRGGNRPAGEFSSLAEDAGGQVWLVFGPHFCQLVNKQLIGLDTSGIAATDRAGLARDDQGRVWGLLGGRLGQLHDGRFEVRYTFDNLPGLLAPAASGGLWMMNGSQLIRIREDRKPEVSCVLSPGITPVCLLEDRTGAIWIGTLSNGLIRYDGKETEVIETSHPHVTSLTEDREGNLWVGTFGGGLNLVRPRVFEMNGPRTGQLYDVLTSVCQDSTGELWITTSSGRLLRGHTQKWVDPPLDDNLKGQDITCVATYKEGSVLVGTSNHGLYAIDIQTGQTRNWSQNEGLPGSAIRGIFTAADGTAWFAAGRPDQICRLVEGEVQVLRQPHGPGSIRAIVQDARGVIWVGNSRGQLSKVVGNELVAEPNLPVQNSRSIRSLHASPDGSLWIGFASLGMGVLKDGHYTLLGAAQGLSDAPYSQIVEDGSGFLWLAGNSELTRLSMAEALAVLAGNQPTVAVTQFGRSDRLMNLQAFYEGFPASCLTREGRILLATGSGLLDITPGKLQENKLKPPVIIETVTMDDQIIARHASRFPLNDKALGDQFDLSGTAAGALRVPPDHRRLSIDFSALSFSAPENANYRYRLEGFDPEWIEAHHDHTAIYPRLPAGDYRFHVIASNDSRIWNSQGSSLAIHVIPFVTQTWWFRMGMLGIFTGIVASTVRYISYRKLRGKVRQLEAQAEIDRERARISRDLHDDLGGSVTHIKLLGEMALQERDLSPQVGENLHQITTTTQQMLKSLNEIVWAVNPRNDTLPNLISYLAQHCLDYMRLAGLQCLLELPDAPPDIVVTPELRHQLLLATKEALTNVVRHSGARTVHLRISLDHQTIQVVVQDDGRGFLPDRNEPSGNGLRNMQQRIATVQGTCTVSSDPTTGTTVRFRLPMPVES